jgi:hypothetical protein
MKIRATVQVLAVEQRKQHVRSFKDTAGNAQHVYEDTGWWLVFPGNFSVHAGNDEPDLKAGDNVLITIEKTT